MARVAFRCRSYDERRGLKCPRALFFYDPEKTSIETILARIQIKCPKCKNFVGTELSEGRVPFRCDGILKQYATKCPQTLFFAVSTEAMASLPIEWDIMCTRCNRIHGSPGVNAVPSRVHA